MFKNYNNYKNAYLCCGCDGVLSYNQKMYSHGRCPLCGCKDPCAATVVTTYDRAYRITSPWWKFWRKDVEWMRGY